MSSAHLGRGRAEGEECRSEVSWGWGAEERGGIRGRVQQANGSRRSSGGGGGPLWGGAAV